MSRDPGEMDGLDVDTLTAIAQYGHQVVGVYGSGEEDDGGFVPFAYTVGRTSVGRPELLLTGPLPPEVGATILNDVAARDDVTPLRPGQALDGILGGGLPVKIVAADPVAAEMNQALHFYGPGKVTALQVLWPDPEGRFPGEEGFTHGPVQPTYPPA